MKKTILIFLIISTYSIGKSQQIQISDLQGKFLLGGNIEYDKNVSLDEEINGETEKEILTTINIGPKIGYFIFNAVSIGLDANYSRYNFKIDDNELFSGSNIQLNPFIRYYTPIKIFTEAQLGFDIPIKPDYLKSTFFQLGIGYPIFIKKNISIDIIGKYYKRKYEDSGYYSNYHTKGLIGTVNFQIYL